MSDRMDEARDWCRLANLANTMSSWVPDWQVVDGAPDEGSIYFEIYPLLDQVSREAERLAGWCLRMTDRTADDA